GSDWDDAADLSFLAERRPAPAPDPGAVAGDPFGFSFDDLGSSRPASRDWSDHGWTEGEPVAGAVTGGAKGAPGDLGEAGSPEDVAWSELLAQPVAPGDLAGLPGEASHQGHVAYAGLSGIGYGVREGGAPAGVPAGPWPGDGGAAPHPIERNGIGAAQRPSPRPEPEVDPAPPGSSPEAVTAGAPGEAFAVGARRSGGRSPLLAVLTGCAAGAVALACFLGGPLPTLLLVAVLVTLATGELLGVMRQRGARPAAPVVLATAPALLVAVYLRGLVAIPPVLAASLFLAFCWYLLDPRRRAPLQGLGSSALVVGWIVLLAGYGVALLAPGTFVARHGLAVLVAAVLLAIGNDVGAYAVGSRLGRHKLAPVVSPGKTWEGAVGGAVLTLLLAALVAARIHPLDLERAMQLGLAVCVLAPLGDLAESLLKRNLGVKDMGDLLPAHGGVLDRIDSILFVLPVAYYLAVAWHLR
ncbi:MAG TPA: phosphatidate cytidylyltransferase, partial [Acidimicrobiales bacterium]|nr:phosphatidate cytidylyltransferase [Acidimicrobiales bacterium]